MELIVKPIEKMAPIEFNYEELKQELAERVQDYKTVVYTADTIKTAKADRAKLNALKKSLNDERIRLEKEYMEPFQVFKTQVTDLVMIVDDAAKAIDKQVKDYEELQKQKKYESIKELFESLFSAELPWLKLEQIMDDKWLNATTTTKKVEDAMNEIKAKILSDMEMLSRLPEYSFEAQETYKARLRVEDALWQADHLKQMAEAKKAIADPEPEQKTLEEFMPAPEEPDKGEPEMGISVLQFRCFCTMEQAMKLRHFMKAEGIQFERI